MHDRDDRVRPLTRAVSWAIVPFLLVAVAVLYPFPDDTGRLFAWRIRPTMTPMVMGAAYLGGAYFFVRAARAEHWHTVKGGFPPVGLFASLLGVATVLHWDRFNHDHVAFWLWTMLYFTTPFLIAWVWVSNRRHDAPPSGEDVVLPRSVAWVLGSVGLLSGAMGLALFLAPEAMIGWWPWLITPLTARVLGAVLCLGLAGAGAFVDRRWSSARLPFQVALLMLTLIIVAGARAHAEFAAGRVLSWLLPLGFVGVTVAMAVVYRRMQRQEGL
jgi:hypothetical protein